MTENPLGIESPTNGLTILKLITRVGGSEALRIIPLYSFLCKKVVEIENRTQELWIFSFARFNSKWLQFICV